MRQARCIPCQSGDHDGHVDVVAQPNPGVMGGQSCPCRGECDAGMAGVRAREHALGEALLPRDEALTRMFLRALGLDPGPVKNEEQR